MFNTRRSSDHEMLISSSISISESVGGVASLKQLSLRPGEGGAAMSAIFEIGYSRTSLLISKFYETCRLDRGFSVAARIYKYVTTACASYMLVAKSVEDN